MTTARRTVDNGTGTDIDVLVDSVDLGDGAGDAPYVKILSGTESATAPWDGTAVGPVGVGAAQDFDAPVKIGGVADLTGPTAVDDGDIQIFWLTTNGQQIVSFNRTRLGPFTPTVDTAVYADLDRLGSVVTVSNAALRNGGSGMIVGAWLQDDALSNFGIEAFFSQVTPTLANADNGIWSMTDANIATAVMLGKIDFLATSSTTYTDGRFCPGLYLGGPVALHYTCASGDSAIYMSLRARGAYDAVATDDLVLYLEVLRY